MLVQVGTVVFIVVRKEIMILTKKIFDGNKTGHGYKKNSYLKVKLAAPLPSPRFQLPSVQWLRFLNTKYELL
jgi:hypothetical protein